MPLYQVCGKCGKIMNSVKTYTELSSIFKVPKRCPSCDARFQAANWPMKIEVNPIG